MLKDFAVVLTRNGHPPPCDACGKPAAMKMDDGWGVGIWNELHPDQPRTMLWFCTPACAFLHGQKLFTEWQKRKK